LFEDGNVYQVIERVVPDFKVVAEPDLQALLGTDIVALVELDLGHQQMSCKGMRVCICM
jgi:predicted secreted protein